MVKMPVIGTKYGFKSLALYLDCKVYRDWLIMNIWERIMIIVYNILLEMQQIYVLHFMKNLTAFDDLVYFSMKCSSM